MDRRHALLTIAGTSLITAPADAMEPFTPAKRPTAYLVDSTMPPTLLPIKGARRESALLKQIGLGSGTSKVPYVEERLNLNNILQKSIRGSVDLVQNLLGNSDKKKDPSFVFLGMDLKQGEDTGLAVRMIEEMVKPRRSMNTAIGLSYIPLSVQPTLDQFLKEGDAQTLASSLESFGIARDIIEAQTPVYKYALENKVRLLALAPETDDLRITRREGLQNVDLARRATYVVDSQGFINLTQDPKFKLYTSKSMMKEYVPEEGVSDDTNANFFAERILYDEAVATAVARYAALTPKDCLVITLSNIQDVRFFGGANGRLPRIYNFLNPNNVIDEESITTFLLNPSAKTTLSLSAFLRLEIGTSPDNWDYQTKVADYLWFSRTPKVNMLPRLMNPI